MRYGDQANMTMPSSMFICGSVFLMTAGIKKKGLTANSLKRITGIFSKIKS
jgi:hypothetical protein